MVLEEVAAADDVNENKEPFDALRHEPNAGWVLPAVVADAPNENPVGGDAEEENPLLKMDGVAGWELEPNKAAVPDGANKLLLELKELPPVENEDEELSPKAEPEPEPNSLAPSVVDPKVLAEVKEEEPAEPKEELLKPTNEADTDDPNWLGIVCVDAVKLLLPSEATWVLKIDPLIAPKAVDFWEWLAADDEFKVLEDVEELNP